MQFGKHTYEQIEQYLSGELAGADLVKFEQKLTQNAELAEELEAHRVAEEMIFENGLLDIKSQLQSIHTNHTTPNPPKPKGGNWKIYTISALVGTALLSTIWLTNQSEGTKNIAKEPISTATEKNIITQPKTKESHKTNSIQHNPTKEVITQRTNEKIANHTVVVNQDVAPKPVETVEKADSVGLVKEEKNHNSLNSNPQLLKPIELGAIKKSTETTQLPIIKPIEVESHDKLPIILNEESRKNPCINFLPLVEFEVSNACWGKSDGEIAIQSVSGGNAPYLVSLQDSTDFQPASNLNLLRAGTYQIWLKDQNGCVAPFSQEIEVEEKYCTNEYSIKPNFNEQWDIPLKSSNSNAQLTIISSKGQVVEQIMIRNGLPNKWNGRAKNGADLAMGSYSFILKYSDGTTEQGYISIVK